VRVPGFLFPSYIDPEPSLFGRLARVAYWSGVVFAAFWGVVGLVVKGPEGQDEMVLLFCWGIGAAGFIAGRVARYVLAAE
jgi:hypothetical protein